MSLFKQISIILSIFMFVLIASIMTLNFRSATTYAQEELYTNAQNTTASLSLALAEAKGDLPTMSTMINAVFDSGYYKEIILLDMNGQELYSRVKDSSNSPVPSWFLNLYDLDVQAGSANVSAGWTPIGILEVHALEESAHIKLFNIFQELFIAFIIISVITAIILFVLLRLILGSLVKVRKQAEAVGKNDFIINESIPYTTEFKEVTLSMNKMVIKVKEIFEQESAAVKNYHKLLYTDSLTGFGNKKYFDLKLKTLIHAEDINANGVILSFFFGGIATANKTLGHDGVDKLLQTFAQGIEVAVDSEVHAMKIRFDGTKFGIVFPSLHIKDINTITQNILKETLYAINQAKLDNKECFVKLSAIEYQASDTVTSVMQNIEKKLTETEINSINIDYTEHLDYDKELQDKKELLEQTLKNKNIALALQPVFNKNMKVYHQEAYIRLMDEQGQILPAGTFMPLVHKMGLDTQLDKNVIEFAQKQLSNTNKHLAINLSAAFIQDPNNFSWLAKVLNKSAGKLSFEISNNDLLNNLKACISFANYVQDRGHYFGLDKFTAESTNLNYLQDLKPSYIKFDSQYLHDMLCGHSGIQNNALQIMIHSLDIKIIATAVEEESIKIALQEVGIEYFQGSLLAKPEMV